MNAHCSQVRFVWRGDAVALVPDPAELGEILVVRAAAQPIGVVVLEVPVGRAGYDQIDAVRL